MQKIRMVAMGCGTLALALGAGHFMQSGGNADVAAAQTSASATDMLPGDATSGALEVTSIEMTSAVPTPPVDAMGPAALPDEPIREASLREGAGATLTDALPVEVSAPSLTCEYSLTADVAPGAMVALSLDAPCATDQRFTLHHNGLMFTDVTDEGGYASMLVPALQRSATFIAAFASGEGAVASADVDSVDQYARVAIQWQGAGGMQLHALEFGAGYASEGHVWAEARRDVAAAAGGDKGFLTRLGDAGQPEALMAEIYTFPSKMAVRDGQVDLRVEAEVTKANCGRDIAAQSLQAEPGAKLRVREVTLAMPDCDAVGDFLVLKNLLNDLTVAAN